MKQYNPIMKTRPSQGQWESDAYRYGFNGKEKDNAIKGIGNSYDFGERLHDPRTGRWLTVDPLAAQGPGYSPYNYAFNNPMYFIDPDGQWPYPNPFSRFFNKTKSLAKEAAIAVVDKTVAVAKSYVAQKSQQMVDYITPGNPFDAEGESKRSKNGSNRGGFVMHGGKGSSSSGDQSLLTKSTASGSADWIDVSGLTEGAGSFGAPAATGAGTGKIKNISKYTQETLQGIGTGQRVQEELGIEPVGISVNNNAESEFITAQRIDYVATPILAQGRVAMSQVHKPVPRDTLIRTGQEPLVNELNTRDSIRAAKSAERQNRTRTND